jgi:predicted HicB family RNase H-like nuclease
MATELRIRHVPEALHKALKLRAVQEEVDLNDLVIELLRQAVEKPSGKK